MKLWRQLGVVAGLLLAVVAGGADWALPDWPHRLACRIPGAGAPVPALPVEIDATELLARAGAAPNLASLRVVGPDGELPCQVVEYDGGDLQAKVPNLRLDPGDRILFQVDVPARGEALCHLYWRSEPTPMAKHAPAVELRDITEPGLFGGDILLRNDRVLASIRGPARLADTTLNKSENWGAGCVTFCALDGKPAVRGGWTSVLPLGAIAGRPSAAAAQWGLPERLEPGAVVGGVDLDHPGAAIDEAGTLATVRHRLRVFGRGGWLRVVEQFELQGATKGFPQEFAFPLRRGDDPGHRLVYSRDATLEKWSPNAAELAQGENGEVCWAVGDLDGWMATRGAGDWAAFLVIVDAGEPLPEEQRRVNAYCRKDTIFRYYRFYGAMPAGERVTTGFWLKPLAADEPDGAGLAAWRLLSERPWQLGDPETRRQP